MSKENRYIVVEGPIGVGKTTLASRIAKDFNGTLVLERAEENPFLEKFYINPRHLALHTQLFFLLQRKRQMEEIGDEALDKTIVADFLLEKDRLFAEATLNDDEFSLYDQIYRELIQTTPKPDLVVYLQAPIEVLLQRIKKRGRRFERPVDTTYLHQLSDSYTRFFHYYSDAALLIVNATEIDFAHNENDYQRLFEQIKTIDKGRHFFNPLPDA
ncbi:MAG TPA: deoxynucleoside kinase, partial [Gammaproteobacteria bacterium]|nr:deoxynucleoside kinase [Gammaproteobacteria bacterium]